MNYSFEGDPSRPLLIFRGGQHILRARLMKGGYTREIWRVFMCLNSAQHRPLRPVDIRTPYLFKGGLQAGGTKNTGEDRRKLEIQPQGGGATVFLFDQPIPASLPDAIRRALDPPQAKEEKSMKSIQGPSSVIPPAPKTNPNRGSVPPMGSLPNAGQSSILSSVKKG